MRRFLKLEDRDVRPAVDQEPMRIFGPSVEKRAQIQQRILAASADHDRSSFDECAVNGRKSKRAVQRDQLDTRAKRSQPSTADIASPTI